MKKQKKKAIINYTNWTFQPAEECDSSDYASNDGYKHENGEFFHYIYGTDKNPVNFFFFLIFFFRSLCLKQKNLG